MKLLAFLLSLVSVYLIIFFDPRVVKIFQSANRLKNDDGEPLGGTRVEVVMVSSKMLSVKARIQS